MRFRHWDIPQLVDRNREQVGQPRPSRVVVRSVEETHAWDRRGKRVCEGRRATRGRRTPGTPIGGSAIVGPSRRRAESTASRRRRGPVALRPRLSPGVPLARESVTELRGGTTAVNYRHSGGMLP